MESFKNHGDIRLHRHVRERALTTLCGMLRAVAADARGFRSLCFSRSLSGALKKSTVVVRDSVYVRLLCARPWCVIYVPKPS